MVRSISRAISARHWPERRDQAVLATKFKLRSSERSARRAGFMCTARRAFANFGTDPIDLLQVHVPSDAVATAESLHGLRQLKAEGKIRAHDASGLQPHDNVAGPARNSATTTSGRSTS